MFAGTHLKNGGIVLLALLCVLSAQTLAYEFAGGSGEPNDPYQIATAEQLLSLGSDPNLLGRHYELIADIDLAEFMFEKAPIAFDANETKSDFQGTGFSGTFDGNGHRISNLSIAGRDYLGLFGVVHAGVIKDVALEDVVILGAGSYVGALLGNSSGWVTNCWSTGSVAGISSVGGLVGHNAGGGWIANCYSTCLVSGNRSGGLVGDNRGPLVNCFSSGAIVGGPSTGGLVGYNDYGSGTTTDCFWDREASGRTSSAGGTGKTTEEMQTAATFLDAGWDFRHESANGLAETWQMPEVDGAPVLSRFHGYTPPTLPGSGSADEPYVLSKPAHLATVYHEPGSCYRLDASIDLSGATWSLPVVPVFFGTFDGNGHAIHNLTIEGGQYSGLFGRLHQQGHVKGLGVVDANIVGTSYVGGLGGTNQGTVVSCHTTGSVAGTSYVGGLIGYNVSSVACCYSTASVTGTSTRVGGLIGYNYNEGSVANCYSTGSVTGGSYVGGLVGYQRGSTDSITYCYSVGPVIGTGTVGGLVGYQYYGSSIANCFWDAATSGQTYSAGGLGLSTAMMRRSQTYTLFGWDFADIWMICQGEDYPRLWWEGVVCEGP